MTYDQWRTDSGYSEKTPEQENEGRDEAPEMMWWARPYEGAMWKLTDIQPTPELRRWLEYKSAT